MRVLDLYRHTDPMLARALEERIDLAAIARNGGFDMLPQKQTGPMRQIPGTAIKSYFSDAVGAAAKFMARNDGPRIGALAFDGWDTHAAEGAANGRLALLLSALDGALASLEIGMGGTWKETAVAVITEFGRTARINGTDHGTATVALLAGGALKGGRVIADWPGLTEGKLYENRDLTPTTDLRAILKGLLRDHLRVDERALATTVFPDSISVRGINGLLA
jgi:uncharacterized protein (DUF1501 family)